MPARVPAPSIACASDLFLARISDSSRGGRRVDFFKNAPGLSNNEWHRGAYNTTIPQGVPKGSATGLSQQAKSAIFQFLQNLNPPQTSQADYDVWIAQMIGKITQTCAQHSPGTLWTFGRSQKLINIFIKYLIAAYHSSFPGLVSLRSQAPWIGGITGFAHAPVDRSTLKVVAKLCNTNTFGTPSNPISWWKPSFNPQCYNQAQTLVQNAASHNHVSRIHYEMTHVW